MDIKNKEEDSFELKTFVGLKSHIMDKKLQG